MDEQPRPRGRPNIGAESHKITFTREDWLWLKRQPSGPTPTIRHLIAEARRKESEMDSGLDPP